MNKRKRHRFRREALKWQREFQRLQREDMLRRDSNLEYSTQISPEEYRRRVLDLIEHTNMYAIKATAVQFPLAIIEPLVCS